MIFFDIVAPIYEKIHPGAVRTFKEINKLGEFRETDKVLDLGGGKGRIAKFFVDKVEEITVLDSSAGMIKRCKKQEGLSCILGEAEKIPFKDSYFNKVIIVEAFHHFQDQRRACQEVRRVLKEDGRVIIEELNSDKTLGWLFEKIENLLLRLKSKFHSPQSLTNFLTKYGFKVLPPYEDQTTYYLVVEK